MKIISIFLLLNFILINGYSQSINKAKLDSLFDLIESKNQGMGSISLFENGMEVYQKSIGFENVEQGKKATAKTKYRIGSISKTFTATIILQLIEEEKLSLETRIEEYFPELPNASTITVEHMLRHRSGLYNFTSSPAYLEWMEDPKSEEELLEVFKENGTVFEPGEKFEYSNTNYVILSFIAEKIENKSFSKIFDERITKGLQLSDVYYGGKIGSRDNEAKSYTMQDGWQVATETDMSIPTGAGAIVSTPTCLNRFFYALFHGGVIKEESLKQMTTIVDNYGLGLFKIPFYERSAYGHNGGIDGFQSNASYFEKDGLGVAYISNGTVMALNDILIGVLSIYFGREYALPIFQPAIEVSSDELEKYLGTYSSNDLPLKITISLNGDQLMAQATGQGAFPLEPYEEHKFRFNPARIKIEFIPGDKEMILNQGGGRFEFAKEE